jgi:type III secretion protein N (ATPase)
LTERIEVGDFFQVLKGRLDAVEPGPAVSGRVVSVRGQAVRIRLDGVRVGDHVAVQAGAGNVKGEVLGFDGCEAVCMLYGDAAGIALGASVRAVSGGATVACGEHLMGRVLDGMGRPVDGRPIRVFGKRAPLRRPPPGPLERRPVKEPFETGIRAIDGFLTLGRGQRVGLFAGPGVGKSTLIGMIARHARSDVNVICLVGERGREVGGFISDSLGPGGLARSVLVCSTGDRPPLERIRCAMTATAIAEHFRDEGGDVLLLMDSVTRFARAQREAGLAAGEVPARHGYPPSVFRALQELLERAGNGGRGTLTAVYTVLVSGGDMEEPVADEARGILDGHIVLSKEIAQSGRHPAIDICGSVSRLMPQVASRDHLAAAAEIRRLMARHEADRDLVAVGAWKPGADRELDRAVAMEPEIRSFLSQSGGPCGMSDTVGGLSALAERARSSHVD